MRSPLSLLTKRCSDPGLIGKPARLKGEAQGFKALTSCLSTELAAHRQLLFGSPPEPTSPAWALLRATSSENNKMVHSRGKPFLQCCKWCPVQQACRVLLGLKASRSLLRWAVSMEALRKASESFPGWKWDSYNNSAPWSLPAFRGSGRVVPTPCSIPAAWPSHPTKNPIVGRKTQQQWDSFPWPPQTRPRPGTRRREEADELQQVSN